jgi:F0F1-type ATP synthase delta subunit
MFDLSCSEIVGNYKRFINRMRLIPDQQFDHLTPEKKTEVIFELNEDQLTGRDCNCFRQMQTIDYNKQDLLEAVELITKDSNSVPELILLTPLEFSESFRDQSEKIISEKIKTPVRIIFKIDSSLILGCKIEFRQKIYDFSFQGQALPLINLAIEAKLQQEKPMPVRAG